MHPFTLASRNAVEIRCVTQKGILVQSFIFELLMLISRIHLHLIATSDDVFYPKKEAASVVSSYAGVEVEERGKTIARAFQLIFCSTNRKPYVAAVRILLRIEHHEKVTIEMLELNHRNKVLPEHC